MTCLNLVQWADDNREDIRNFLATDPSETEMVEFIRGAYPDPAYLDALLERLPTSAVQILAKTWTAADTAGREFEMNSVGPDEEQLPAIPDAPTNGLRIVLQFDGAANGKASIFFHGLGEAEDFFSHDDERFDRAGDPPLPWYSTGQTEG